MGSGKTYVGLAAVTAATLFVEIVLTRNFSVVLWYHFAFVAVSLAMLGMAGGAMYVYLHRDRYQPDQAQASMAKLTAWFGTTLVLAYLAAMGVAFQVALHLAAVVALALTVGLWLVPFFFSGMIVAIALTRTRLSVGRLYAADLVGAAAGCLLVQPAFANLGLPGSIAAAALALYLTGAWMARGTPQRPATGRVSAGVAALVLLLVVSVLAPDQLSPRWIKGQWEGSPGRVFWNAYSRIAIHAPRTSGEIGLRGWGYGRNFDPTRFRPTRFCNENIDAAAGTWITEFDGDLSRVGYLAWDVTNLPYDVRSDGDVVVIGVGGGRDILSALSMGQRTVTGVEINPVFVRLLQRDYADFSGHLAQRPDVELVISEARNWLERTDRRFDVIQISLIDTWAASASGAYTLSEHTLYTAEAWRTFLGRLKPGGVLSVSRWYQPQHPAEAYRLAALAEAALSARGVSRPGQCVAALANRSYRGSEVPCIVTLLASPEPLSGEDCLRLREAAEEYGFDVLYLPSEPTEPYATILDPARSAQWLASYKLDVSAPTDDRPYFFYMVRPADVLALGSWQALRDSQGGTQRNNTIGMLVLGVLGSTLLLAAIGLTVVPLTLREGRGVWSGSDRLAALYFAAIGLAFMLVEIAFISRTGIMLGHPIYGLQVTLFSLLLGSGLGSLLSSELPGTPERKLLGWLPALVLGTAVVFMSLGPVINALSGSPQPVRIATVAGVVAVLGLLMGAAFPLGLAVARRGGREQLLPWLWGVNGVFSVLGSFVATTLGIFAGVRAAGLLGVACYAVAWIAISLYIRRRAGAALSAVPSQ
ncbi:MAG TPA: hypothetical protein VM283_02060 [Armatimonadota bacterium]|nr:hypothetical protein [Armatimonadota bacterium]